MPAKNVVEAQEVAKEYSRRILTTIEFKLGDSAEFAVPIIQKELIMAYIEGYWTGVEDQRRRK